MKRIILFALAIVLVLGTSIPSYAAGLQNSEGYVQSSESLPQCEVFGIEVADDVDITISETLPNAPITVEVPLPRIVNDTGTRTIKAGSNYTKTFTMSNGSGTPHNAFSVVITNPTAKYTLIISYDGIEIWNQQYTAGCSSLTSPCSVGQNFKVMVINDTSSSMTAQIDITSYIK